MAKLYNSVRDALLELRVSEVDLAICEHSRPFLVGASGAVATNTFTAENEILAAFVQIRVFIVAGNSDRYPGTLKRGAAHARDGVQQRGPRVLPFGDRDPGLFFYQEAGR